MSTPMAITKGTIVEYANKSLFYLAAILNTDTPEKLRVINENTDELNISIKQLTLILNTTLNINLPPNNISNQLSELNAQANYLITQCDPEQLWNLLATEDDTPQQLALQTAAEFFFSNPQPQHILATARALRNDKIYFKTQPTNTFITRTQIQVQARLIQQKTELDRNRLKDKFLSLCLPILQNKQPINDDNELCSDPEIHHIIKTIQKYAIFGDEHPAKNDAEYFINHIQANLRTSIEGHSSTFKARDLLRKLKIWNNLTNPALLRYRIPIEFPQNLQTEVQNLINQHHDFSYRTDLTHLNTFTIDDPDTKDLDDALSIYHDQNQNTVLAIHIAAPQATLQWNSDLESEARKRASSLYLPYKTIHIFPPELSESFFSLTQNQTKPALTFLCTFDHELSLINQKIIPSIINVNKRLSYNEADQLLEFGFDNTADELREIQIITENNYQNRLMNGAIDLDLPAFKLLYDHLTNHITLYDLDPNVMSRALVSETMIMANTIAANFATLNKITIPYRTQAPPTKNIPQKELDNIKNPLLKELTLKSTLMPAVQSIFPAPHAGLGLNAYTQITSPIRRYADLLTSYQIENFILHNKPLLTRSEIEPILLQNEQATADNKAAAKETYKLWTLKYIQQENKPIKATILNYTTERSDLANIILDQTQLQLTLSTLKRYPPGTKCIIECESINPDQNIITPKLINIIEEP